MQEKVRAMVDIILFPSSFLDGKRIDEDMQNEYEAAIDTGLWEVVLFSYEKWFHDGVLVLSKEIPSPVTAVYRGWMMKGEQYASFYHKLREKGITLVTDPKAYQYFIIFQMYTMPLRQIRQKCLQFRLAANILWQIYRRSLIVLW